MPKKVKTGKVELQKVFTVVTFDDKNEDGYTAWISPTLEKAEDRAKQMMDDPAENWVKESDFKPGEDPAGQSLKRWRETTQAMLIEIQQHWVE